MDAIERGRTGEYWGAAFRGAAYGYVEGQVALADAFSFGLGSRLGLDPKEFQNDPIYQTAYGFGGVARDTLITVATLGTGGAAVAAERAGGGVLARIGISKAPTILGATVKVAPAVHRAASLYNTGLGIYGLGTAAYHAKTHQLTGWGAVNTGFGALSIWHLGGGFRSGGVGGLFDAAAGGPLIGAGGDSASAMHAPGGGTKRVIKVYRSASQIEIYDPGGNPVMVPVPKTGQGITVHPTMMTMDQVSEYGGLTGDEWFLAHIETSKGSTYTKLWHGDPTSVEPPPGVVRTATRFEPVGHSHLLQTSPRPSIEDVEFQAQVTSRAKTQLNPHQVGAASGATFVDRNIPGTNRWLRFRTKVPTLVGAGTDFTITNPRKIAHTSNGFYDIVWSGTNVGQVTVNSVSHAIVKTDIFPQFQSLITH